VKRRAVRPGLLDQLVVAMENRYMLEQRVHEAIDADIADATRCSAEA